MTDFYNHFLSFFNATKTQCTSTAHSSNVTDILAMPLPFKERGVARLRNNLMVTYYGDRIITYFFVIQLLPIIH